jgi:hypothetical protein
MYVAPSNRIIHKGLLGPNGELGALCFEPIHPLDVKSEYAVLSSWLHDEITCRPCLHKLELEPGVSRGQLLRDNLSIRLAMAFQLIDANYWNRNIRQTGEAKINPDPHGQLASEFLRLTEEFDQLITPVRQAMEKHEALHGWPNTLY